MWPYILVAFLGGTGGVGVKEIVLPSRPDPFYGAQGMEQDARHLKILEHVEERLDRMEARQLVMLGQVNRLPPAALLKRVTVVEESQKSLVKDVRRLEAISE